MMKKIIGYASIFFLGVSSYAVAFDTRQLIALKNSDISGTCWETSFSSGTVHHKFNSDGTYERTQFNINPTSIIIWRGDWKISSNQVWLKAIDVTAAGRTVSSENSEWEESFVFRNGKLVWNDSVYTLGCN